MSRRIEGAIVELDIGKTREKDVDIKRITLEGPARRVSINNTSVSLQVFPLLQRGAQATLYVGGPFLFFLPSQIFGVRTAAGEAFSAPRAIIWIPGALVILAVAVPAAMLPITLLLFPILVLAAIWMVLLSWSGMGARARFNRDSRRAAKTRADTA